MKVELHEHDNSFGISLTPETIEEAAQLVRLSLNATKEVRSIDTSVYRAPDSTPFESWIVLGKRRNSRNGVRNG